MHPAQQDNPIAVVDRIAAVINVIADQRRPISVRECARLTGIPNTTVNRIVRSLIPHGLVEFQGDGLVLGLRFFELGEQVARPRSLRRLTFAHMERLRSVTGNTVHLAVLDGGHVVYIEILRPRLAPELPSRVGGRIPAHATGVGKALLAFSRPEITERLIADGLRQVGPRTITDPAALLAELREVRECGIATELSESQQGVGCVAAPILVGEDEAIAAISVSGLANDMNFAVCEREIRRATTALRRQAAALPHSGRTM